ncbi:MAG: DUF1727 domain-containing protein [Ferrimicrobium sp.]
MIDRRDRLVGEIGRLIARSIRIAGAGDGGSLPGRVVLGLAPQFLSSAGRFRATALITGTNGKTTTTRLVSELVSGVGSVVSNQGANLPGGIASAIAVATRGRCALDRFGVFEVDEAYLGQVAKALRPKVVAVLNLSRDQLDRSAEVRLLADKISQAARYVPCVVANADDPLVVWAVRDFEEAIFVGGLGTTWTLDSVACPACDRALERDSGEWWCSCGLRRPEPEYALHSGGMLWHEGDCIGAVDPGVPGVFNQFNAVIAVAVAHVMTGVPSGELISQLGGHHNLGGRFSRWVLTGLPGGPELITYLAKNPAGWDAIIALVEAEPDRRLVLGLNANVADGFDTSWIWDLPLERLAGMKAIVSGSRARDLALRCEVAGVTATVVEDPISAIVEAAISGEVVSYLGNYTAFGEMRRRLSAIGALEVADG